MKLLITATLLSFLELDPDPHSEKLLDPDPHSFYAMF